MSTTCWWPADYFSSRDRFVELARSCGAQAESHSIDAVGPDGEALSVEVAAFTSTHDEHLIILTSGVHGVEGFIGACIQFQALQMLANNGLANGVGVVMIHAVNPWGFAHLRRVDEGNVDVNRNFSVSPDNKPAPNPDYAALDPVINPRGKPGIGSEIDYWINAGKLITRNRGIKKLFKSIAEGQHEFPQGLFFGGHEISHSCALLQKLVQGYAANIDRITILDVHSGLGPSGVATLIGDSNMVDAGKRYHWLQTHYRQPVFIGNASDNTYNAQGSWSQWCQHNLRDKRFLYLCVEIGTVNPLILFSALRRENQAHHWTASDSRSYVRSKQALLDVFAPRSNRWRQKAIAQGLHVLDRTFAV
ncbi:MAG: DUF2817 domain-containing protein [Granulosicoccus sp.]|nr:DUF2817 domain-containing protein [Granulosicoccus sp.]